MKGDLLLTFNAGSSTIKIGVFEADGAAPRRIAKGVIDFRAEPLRFSLAEGPEAFEAELESQSSDDLTGVLSETLDWLGRHFEMGRIAAIGHRVVHGGEAFAGPVAITPDVVEAIEKLTVLAPLHQPQSIRLIRAIAALHPELRQTASFDTAFHRTNDEIVRRFALPRSLHDEGIKRYGFHGLSYQYIAGELARRYPRLADGRVVAAHLGSGASICGLHGGASRDTSMGFSTLDGIPMATRCGALDPGVLLHLLGAGGRSLSEVEKMLYYQSGLLGVSGISADSRELLASDSSQAHEALELFALRIAGEIARIAATLQGLDAVVFTAGIGENQPKVRADVCARLGWLGLDLDSAANTANAEVISGSASRVTVLVIPTDEEQVIADDALAALAGASV